MFHFIWNQVYRNWTIYDVNICNCLSWGKIESGRYNLKQTGLFLIAIQTLIFATIGTSWLNVVTALVVVGPVELVECGQVNAALVGRHAVASIPCDKASSRLAFGAVLRS